jgi:phage baseplate assembly protein W
MRPDFGSVIHDLLFDPFDEETKSLVIEDAIRIIGQDPRVTLVSIDAKELEHVLRVEVELHFTPQDVVDQLFVEYDRQNKEAI